MALRAVVLPAPFGPMSPTMRPSSTVRSILFRATLAPNALRKPRASMLAMASTLLLRAAWGGLQQLCGLEPESLDRGLNLRPLIRQESFAFSLEEQSPRTRIDEHSPTPSALDELLVDQLLITLEDRERTDTILGGDVANGGKWIALVQHPIEDHGHHAIA